MDKALAKLVKRGDDRTKPLAQKVLDNAARVSKQKAIDSKRPSALDAAKKPLENGAKTATNTVGTKNTSSGVAASTQPVKKQIGATSAAGALAKGNARLEKRQEPGKPDAKGAIKNSNAPEAAAKAKASHISAKPSAFFSSLQSASKKPGTSISSQIPRGREVKERSVAGGIAP